MKALPIVGLTLALSACSLLTSADVQKQAAQVQALAVKTCNFLPTLGSVVGMLTAANPTVVGVTAIAAAICEGVKSIPSITQHGNPIEGSDCPVKINEVCLKGAPVKEEK